MKIGLFGGTFDPIHNGHLMMAEAVREDIGLTKIIFIPNAVPPHKDVHQIANADARLHMIQLAILGNPFFETSTVELDRNSPSYTLDTILDFKKKYPQDELYFIAGLDSLYEMHSWYKVDELVKLCKFVFIPRPGLPLNKQGDVKLHLLPDTYQVLMRQVVETIPCGISSTDIRKRVATGRSIRYLVPEKVMEFIQKQGLYKEKGDNHKL